MYWKFVSTQFLKIFRSKRQFLFLIWLIIFWIIFSLSDWDWYIRFWPGIRCFWIGTHPVQKQFLDWHICFWIGKNSFWTGTFVSGMALIVSGSAHIQSRNSFWTGTHRFWNGTHCFWIGKFVTCAISWTNVSEKGSRRMPARSLSVLLLPSIW